MARYQYELVNIGQNLLIRRGSSETINKTKTREQTEAVKIKKNNLSDITDLSEVVMSTARPS